jgi:hypothetical protein
LEDPDIAANIPHCLEDRNGSGARRQGNRRAAFWIDANAARRPDRPPGARTQVDGQGMRGDQEHVEAAFDVDRAAFGEIA